MMTLYTVSIYEDGVWAGSGPRDQYGHIECAAVLSADPGGAQHLIYEEIEDAVTDAVEVGESAVKIVVNVYTYTMSIESEER